MIIPAPTSTRGHLGRICNDLHLLGEAVEVGVHRGWNAVSFLANWQGRMLYCVDPWSVPLGYEDQVRFLGEGSRGDRQEDYVLALAHLNPWINDGRCKILRATSAAAFHQFEDGQLDFVYIDGDHRMQEVYADLVRWWPKLRQGGILAIHDYVCPGEKDGGWGAQIQPACEVFLNWLLRDKRVKPPDTYLIVEENGLPWTAYWIK